MMMIIFERAHAVVTPTCMARSYGISFLHCHKIICSCTIFIAFTARRCYGAAILSVRPSHSRTELKQLSTLSNFSSPVGTLSTGPRLTHYWWVGTVLGRQGATHVGLSVCVSVHQSDPDLLQVRTKMTSPCCILNAEWSKVQVITL